MHSNVSIEERKNDDVSASESEGDRGDIFDERGRGREEKDCERMSF